MKDRIQTAVHELLGPVKIAGQLRTAPGEFEVTSVSDSVLLIRTARQGIGSEYHRVTVEKVKQ